MCSAFVWMTDYNAGWDTRLQSVDNSPEEKWAKTKSLLFWWMIHQKFFFSPTKISQKMISFDVFPLKLNLILFLGNILSCIFDTSTSQIFKGYSISKIKIKSKIKIYKCISKLLTNFLESSKYFKEKIHFQFIACKYSSIFLHL